MGMKRRDFVRQMEGAGWSLVREGSSHTVYRKKSRNFEVPRHKEVNSGIVRTWEKLNKELDEEG